MKKRIIIGACSLAAATALILSGCSSSKAKDTTDVAVVVETEIESSVYETVIIETETVPVTTEAPTTVAPSTEAPTTIATTTVPETEKTAPAATADDAETNAQTVSSTERTWEESLESVDLADADYIANRNTGKFHYPKCNSVDKMSEKNKIFFNGTREDLIEKGYEPCENCHP